MKFKQFIEEEFKSTETFNFLSRNYDVSKAKNLIRKYPEKIKTGSIDVDDWSKYIQSSTKNADGSISVRPGILVGDKRAAEKKLNDPVIVVSEKNFVFIIDGWHRLRKASMTGVKKLPAYLIDDPELLKDIKI